MPINVPNLLTLSRLVLVPFVILTFLNGHALIAFALLLVGELTDFFDGYLARKLGQETHFGAIFDPIADKLTTIVYYGFLASQGLAPVWFVAIVIVRNFSQALSLPILVWWLKRKFYVKPKKLPKWAQAFNSIYVFFPLFLFPLGLDESWGLPLMVLISLMELEILRTYLPRLIAIARGTHDTFE